MLFIRLEEKSVSQKRPFPYRWIAVALLLLAYGLAVNSLQQLGPTFDEQGFLVRGLAYLRGDSRTIRVGHPLGLNALNALLLVDDETVRLPTDDPAWGGTDFHRPAELFLWEIGNDVAHIMFLARLPTIWLGLLLAALAGRWAWALSRRRWAGLLALTFVAFDPNIMAHSRLITTDLGLAAGTLFAAFTLWHFWQRPDAWRAILAGIAFGLLQDTKFTAGLFVPLFAIVILLYWLRERRLRPLLLLTGAYVLVAPLTLWALYGFQVGTLPSSLPLLPQLGGLTLPLAHHLEQLLDIGGRLSVSTPAFLLGNYSKSGWWYYFPVAFALKTPLPTLLLLVAALALRLPRWRRRYDRFLDDAALLVPALGYFAIALTTEINLGYRHLLPVLPLLVVFSAAALARAAPVVPVRRRAALGLATAWLLGAALWIHPHPLAFFNLFAGGPNNGWRALVDSNLDWGQDLGNLAAWLEARDIDHVWLSYFGEGRPDYYGIGYTGLDSYPPRLMNPNARPLYPADPAPGIYAISATTLQGVHFQDHERLAWFRDRTPLAKIGYSIFVYVVAASSPPIDLSLGGLQIDALTADDFALLGGNNVVPHWFDPASSLLLPGGSDRWLALDPQAPRSTALLAGLTPVAESAAYLLYRLPDAAPLPAPRATFRGAAGSVSLLSHNLPPDPIVAAGTALDLTTTWQKAAPPLPLQIFVHLTDPAGEIVAQWDGLGAAWEGWRAGDTLVQTHRLDLRPDLAPGLYGLRIGLYEPQNGRRWRLDGDREWVDLPPVTVVAPEEG